MFVDKVTVELSSGKGGAGCVAFRREKFVVKGGPNGGDGGRGGSIVFVVNKNSHTLAWFKGTRHLKAENGKPGLGSNMTGKSGKTLEIQVPPGTQVIDVETGEVLFDLLEDGEKVKYIDGGKGGLGNTHFKSSTNQRPTYAQPGETGITREVRLELKLIADVGLVGFPNVGKSTLISSVSNATPEIANYEFTTLTPKLGQVAVNEYEYFVMADIPGIIGGASDGKGLGLQFLQHIERTKTLLFMIDIASYREAIDQYNTLKLELESFSSKLSTRSYAIALTRSDAVSPEDLPLATEMFLEEIGLAKSKKSNFGFNADVGFYEQDQDEYDKSKPWFVAPISSVAKFNIEALNFALFALVRQED